MSGGWGWFDAHHVRALGARLEGARENILPRVHNCQASLHLFVCLVTDRIEYLHKVATLPPGVRLNHYPAGHSYLSVLFSWHLRIVEVCRRDNSSGFRDKRPCLRYDYPLSGMTTPCPV